MTVRAPLSTTTWPHSTAAAAAAAARAASSSTRSPSASGSRPLPARRRGELADVRREDGRPADAVPPGVGRGEAAERLGVEHDRRRPTGSLRRAGHERGRGIDELPGWRGRAAAPDRRRARRARGRGSGASASSGSSSSTSSSGRPSVVASTTLAANSGWSDSGTARVTRPAPARAGRAADEERRSGVVERAGERRGPCRTSPCGRAPGAPAAGPRPPRRRARRGRAPRTVGRGGRPRPTWRSRRSSVGRPKPTARSGIRDPPRRGSRSRSMRARIRRSRSSSRSSMSGGKTNRPPVRPDAERDRHRVVGLVADRDRDAAHPELLGPGRGPAVQPHRGLAGRQALDLDVAPADAPDAEPEHLRDRLLGRPAAGHRLGPAADVRCSSGVRTRRVNRSPNRASEAAIRSTLMMSMPSSVVPGGTMPGGSAGSTASVGGGHRPSGYSTVTDLARLRGWSTSVPRATAMW